MVKFEGVWPALVTPFTEDNVVNVAVLRQIVDYLIGKGVDGFYIGGTTGEGIFTPVEQRRLVIETVLDQVSDRLPVIVHVGCVAVKDAIELARHARENGAVAISSIVPPLYGSTASIVEYFRVVAQSAPGLPFLPYLLNPNIDALALMCELMKIPNVQGTKYTGPNMYEFRRILDLGLGNWTMFSGMDEQTLYAAMNGATGNIGSTVNFMPGAYRSIREHCLAGQYSEAQEIQLKANEVTSTMIDVGFSGALKEVMHILGFDCGAPRLPSMPLSNEQRSTLRVRLEQTEFQALVAM